ncbi:PTS fructose transporter subunit IIABC [Marinobacterium rhizophilum]|uniref:PTS fructose transporter subunit IIABC n=1 Tax=Marinobacterium rhizophilum TaxID=420402 RepID=UPI000374EC46|nr:fructose-specific PTS transporter subunit EIIC [Marinobacterium rhizophilum]
MALTQLLSTDRIALDLKGRSKEDVLAEMVAMLDDAGKLEDPEAFLDAVLAREATGSTGLEQGIAMPHARSQSVREPALAFAIAREGIEFGALDGKPSQLFLMIAEPADADSQHLDVLAAASCHLIDPAFRERLMLAKSETEILQLFAEAEGIELPQLEVQAEAHLVAVTSCPAGIAHTYMAAERLQQAARELHLDLLVETHGSAGVRGALSVDDIHRADAVLLAVDRNIGLQRFAGKPLLQVPVTDAIRHPKRLLLRALRQPALGAPGTGEVVGPATSSEIDHWGFYRHLMTGVSSMLPFVVGGGILITLSLLFGIDAADPASPDFNPLAKLLLQLGGPMGAFGLMVPVLAAFIGRSIADRPGLMPAMVGGYIAAQAGAGFLGGMVAGLIGGYGVLLLQRLCRVLPDSLDAIRTILIYPVLGLLLCGSLMLWLVEPMSTLNAHLVDWLNGLNIGNRIVLGGLLAGLMAVDMGGPVNKAAYTFGIAAIEAGNYFPQAAVMAGGMVPPLGLGLATLLFPAVFTKLERQSGRACLIMGASFITEGAIPYAVADPLRVIPACILGSMLAGCLSMLFQCQLLAPHGGVFVIPLVRNWPGYILAIAAGALLTASLVVLLKRFFRPRLKRRPAGG